MKLADVVLGVSLFNGLRELRRGFQQTGAPPQPSATTRAGAPAAALPAAPRYEMPKLDAAATAVATVRVPPSPGGVSPGRAWGRAFVPRVCAGAPKMLGMRSVVRAPGLLGSLPVESWRVVPLGQGEANAAEVLQARTAAGMSALASLSLVLFPLGGDPACYLVFADPSEARHGSVGGDFALLAEPGGDLDVVVPMPGDAVAATAARESVKAPPPKPRAPKRAAAAPVEAAPTAPVVAAPHLNGASKANHVADATADTDPAPAAPAAGEA